MMKLKILICILLLVVTAVSVSTAEAAEGYDSYLHGVYPVYLRTLYRRGAALGANPATFSKVGDSITDEQAFLHPFGWSQYNLGEYSSLQTIVTLYDEQVARTDDSFANDSLSAVPSWTSSDILSAERSAEWDFCEGAIPLHCEYAMVHPSIALIMVGSNDPDEHIQNGVYEQNLRQIVSYSIRNGIIPVLYTVPPHQYRDVTPINNIVKRAARAYYIPWIDYHAAMVGLPSSGLRDDGVHPSIPPDGLSGWLDEYHLQYGHTVRNLLTLLMLQRIQDVVTYAPAPVVRPAPVVPSDTPKWN